MNELLSYQIGFIILYIGFIFTAYMAIMDSVMRKKLYKHGILTTKKGTYTFTPAKEKVQDV